MPVSDEKKKKLFAFYNKCVRWISTPVLLAMLYRFAFFKLKSFENSRFINVFFCFVQSCKSQSRKKKKLPLNNGKLSHTFSNVKRKTLAGMTIEVMYNRIIILILINKLRLELKKIVVLKRHYSRVSI